MIRKVCFALILASVTVLAAETTDPEIPRQPKTVDEGASTDSKPAETEKKPE